MQAYLQARLGWSPLSLGPGMSTSMLCVIWKLTGGLGEKQEALAGKAPFGCSCSSNGENHCDFHSWLFLLWVLWGKAVVFPVAEL